MTLILHYGCGWWRVRSDFLLDLAPENIEWSVMEHLEMGFCCGVEMANYRLYSTKRNGRSNDIWLMDPQRFIGPLVESSDGTWWDPETFRQIIANYWFELCEYCRCQSPWVISNLTSQIDCRIDRASLSKLSSLAYDKVQRCYLTSNKGSEFVTSDSFGS